MIQSIDAEALIKQAAEDHETIGTIGTSATVGTGFVQIVIELLHRYSGLKQRMIAERFGGRFGEPRSQTDPGKARD